MAVSILTSNSGTTFLRTGGVNKIKIKSNLAWTFKLLPLNDSNDVSAVTIQTAETEDEEVETTLVGTGTTFDNIKWINIVNDLGDSVKEITGQGTTYLNIRADENFTGKDLFAVGYAEAISEPNICDYTVFEQYGLNYYFIYFDYDEEVSGQTIHTPSAITPETTEIPVEIYTNTKTRVTIFGFSGINNDTGEEFVVGTGVTKTGYPDETFVFKFNVPKNKTAEDIEYTIRGTSEDDPRYTVEYKVIHKGIVPEILLSPPRQSIGYNVTSFVINYKIKPLTLSVDLGIFRNLPTDQRDVYTLIETRTVSNSSIGSEEPHYIGAITYECGENPNKGDGENSYIKYRVSGATSGETFVVSSTTTDVSTNGNALVDQRGESYYFELIYENSVAPVGGTVYVGNIDGDSGGGYIVRVHTNYNYNDFEILKDSEFINEAVKVYEGENGFNVLFNVKINEEASQNHGVITVRNTTNQSIYGYIDVSQNAGTVETYEFYWTGADRGNYTAYNGEKDVSNNAATYTISFYSNYPGGNVRFEYFAYDRNVLSNFYTNGNALVIETNENTSSSTRKIMLAAYVPNSTDANGDGGIVIYQGGGTNAWKYQFKFNYSCNNILEVGDTAYISAITMFDNGLSIYAAPDCPLQIDPSRYTEYDTGADIYTTYEGGSHEFSIKIQWNISGIQQSDYIDTVTKTLPETGQAVVIDFGWINLPVQY